MDGPWVPLVEKRGRCEGARVGETGTGGGGALLKPLYGGPNKPNPVTSRTDKREEKKKAAGRKKG